MLRLFRTPSGSSKFRSRFHQSPPSGPGFPMRNMATRQGPSTDGFDPSETRTSPVPLREGTSDLRETVSSTVVQRDSDTPERDWRRDALAEVVSGDERNRSMATLVDIAMYLVDPCIPEEQSQQRERRFGLLLDTCHDDPSGLSLQESFSVAYRTLLGRDVRLAPEDQTDLQRRSVQRLSEHVEDIIGKTDRTHPHYRNLEHSRVLLAFLMEKLGDEGGHGTKSSNMEGVVLATLLGAHSCAVFSRLWHEQQVQQSEAAFEELQASRRRQREYDEKCTIC